MKPNRWTPRLTPRAPSAGLIVSLALGIVPTALAMHLWNRLEAVQTAPPRLVRLETPPPVYSEAPACPECGRATRKVPAGAGLGGRAGGQPAQGGGTPQLQGLQALLA